ncbi:S8 family serine peptidase [Actinoplanes sp. TBRC 11911]|uniref:S8 family serine peptidase n=1 Tax=Actinoplanes sp. TBRC 11911 TaxID=2729386 RepID=UPI0020071CA0|nr:S8 family serine peptidase [Actinoplanes sp. TBRC 11911]
MKNTFRLFGAGAAAMAGVAALTLPQLGAAGTTPTSLAQASTSFTAINPKNPADGDSLGVDGAGDEVGAQAQGAWAEGDGGVGSARADGAGGRALRATTATDSTAGAGPVRQDGSVTPVRWRPVSRGLAASPASLLPDTVSRTRPVRVVSTTLAGNGAPVITARTATDTTSAADLITAAQRAPQAVGVELDTPVRVADAPAGDDPLRAQQWDLARMSAPQAWTRSTGAGVTVAVVDTGVDSTHPDLAGQVLPGGDFITGTEGAAVDPNGHGTHVAGTIAAVAGNNVGVSGVAPNAKILPVRVLGADGRGYTSTAAAGVVYAADHGADVINLSLSSTTPTDAMTNAVAYAHAKNVVVVAAAGNARGQGSPISYPAASDGVIAVAATDSADGVATFSNRGSYVDVAAPGVNIVSTRPGNLYARMSGTSMAAPHVAAVAALVRSAYPALSPDQIESALKSSAVDLGPAGRDDDFGAGLVDASAALTSLAPPAPIVPAVTKETNPPAEPKAPATQAPATQAPPTQAPPTQAPPTQAPPAQAPTDNRPPVDVRLVNTAPGQLLVAIRDPQAQTVELQRDKNGTWETIYTYKAALSVRLTGLPTGTTYRVVVADGPGYRAATSKSVRL